ncbi:MAG: DUF2237 family protein [Acidimicrobiales bacterium]
MAQNVLGDELQTCGTSPLTGFYRTGCCDTGADDDGVHTVCAQVTEEFLVFSKEQGNDLDHEPGHGFAGLAQAIGGALCQPVPKPSGRRRPPVVLEHRPDPRWIDLADLRQHAADPA